MALRQIEQDVESSLRRKFRDLRAIGHVGLCVRAENANDSFHEANVHREADAVTSRVFSLSG
jgi:hypothetical protein